MIMQVPRCIHCGRLMQYIQIMRKYNNNETAVLPKQYCPKCNEVELSGDDIDFFIFGGETPKPIGVLKISQKKLKSKVIRMVHEELKHLKRKKKCK